jgi:hypothetical protein
MNMEHKRGFLMKRVIVLIALVLAAVAAYAVDSAGNTQTAVSSSIKYLTAGMEQLTSYVDVKTVKGAPVPVIDRDVLKYMTSVGFVFNSTKTGALMVMEVKKENFEKVKAILAQKNTLINTDNAVDLEKEYKGFENKIKKHRGK